MDNVSSNQRSRNMAAIRSRDTRPEIIVRSILHSLGFRFRLHQRSLPGSPDIVLRRHSAVVLVHGCFWHGHSCARGKIPATRQDFWLPKLAGNRERDERQVKELKRLGWRVLTVWECETKDATKLSRLLVRWLGMKTIN